MAKLSFIKSLLASMLASYILNNHGVSSFSLPPLSTSKKFVPSQSTSMTLSHLVLNRHQSNTDTASLSKSFPLKARGGGEIADLDANNQLKFLSKALAVTIAAITALKSSLVSGPLGVLSLTAIASAIVTPLTLYRQAYSFSVGYGFSVAAMCLAMLFTFNPSTIFSGSMPNLLALSGVFYGVRLGLFLLVREWTVAGKAESVKKFDKSPPLKRIPFSISVGMFYAFLCTPILYVLRGSGGGDLTQITNVGVTIAWIGALLEAVADTHKFLVKRNAKDDFNFIGPTGGVYLLSRHPNYLGEIMFWSGIFVSGLSSFGTQIIPWICSSLGLVGIFFIMFGATKRLDKIQLERYGGQAKYDDWVGKVTSPIIPFIS